MHTQSQIRTFLLALMAAAAIAFHGCRAAGQTPAQIESGVAGPDLSSWSSSQDLLVDQLVAALASNDAQALHRLRVTREEYLSIIVPGTVPPGQPPRQVRDKVAETYWQLLDSRSRDFGRVALHEFGGQKLKKTSQSYSTPPKEYAGYRAFGELRVEVENDKGGTGTVRSGWVAEVDGRYKLIGFEWDD